MQYFQVYDRPGFFVEPTIVTGLKHDSPLVQTECFAPIVYVLKCDSIDEAIKCNNEVPQGLSSSIFTQSIENIFKVRYFNSALSFHHNLRQNKFSFTHRYYLIKFVIGIVYRVYHVSCALEVSRFPTFLFKIEPCIFSTRFKFCVEITYCYVNLSFIVFDIIFSENNYLGRTYYKIHLTLD